MIGVTLCLWALCSALAPVSAAPSICLLCTWHAFARWPLPAVLPASAVLIQLGQLSRASCQCSPARRAGRPGCGRHVLPARPALHAQRGQPSDGVRPHHVQANRLYHHHHGKCCRLARLRARLLLHSLPTHPPAYSRFSGTPSQGCPLCCACCYIRLQDNEVLLGIHQGGSILSLVAGSVAPAACLAFDDSMQAAAIDGSLALFGSLFGKTVVTVNGECTWALATADHMHCNCALRNRLHTWCAVGSNPGSRAVLTLPMPRPTPLLGAVSDSSGVFAFRDRASRQLYSALLTTTGSSSGGNRGVRFSTSVESPAAGGAACQADYTVRRSLQPHLPCCRDCLASAIGCHTSNVLSR